MVMVEIAQLTFAQDGKLTDVIQVVGPFWQNAGVYFVKASYGDTIVETNFEFFTKGMKNFQTIQNFQT